MAPRPPVNYGFGKGSFMKSFAVLISLASMSFATAVSASEINWEGAYRVEAMSLQNPSQSSAADAPGEKSYILHHVILQPKIVAADGLNLYGRLDVFNNANYADSQMGDFLGGAPSTGSSRGVGTTGTNTQTQQAATIQVSHFYLKWANEFGALIVGRTPVQFGLGITHNAGLGQFDHYFDTHDVLGYKFIAGNLSFLPMYGKVKENSLVGEDDINDFMFQFQYENPDTELNLGVFYDIRSANKAANASADGAAVGTPYGGSGATKFGTLETKTLNLFVQRNFGNLRFGFESSFANGKLGVRDSVGRETNLDAYALAAELTYNPSGALTFDLKAGLATGDDPGTTDKFEGYLFDRNYDVGFLLFNHKLGGYDVLGTSSFRNTTAANQFDTDAADNEYLTNATYIAPGAGWHMSEAWTLNTHVIWAQLQRSVAPVVPNARNVEKDLGIEWDLGLSYNPNKNLTVELGSGFLFPGGAFKGSADLPNEFSYGLNAKAAVRF